MKPSEEFLNEMPGLLKKKWRTDILWALLWALIAIKGASDGHAWCFVSLIVMCITLYPHLIPWRAYVAYAKTLDIERDDSPDIY